MGSRSISSGRILRYVVGERDQTYMAAADHVGADLGALAEFRVPPEQRLVEPISASALPVVVIEPEKLGMVDLLLGITWGDTCH